MTTTTLREAAEAALDTLDRYEAESAVADALRAALAQPVPDAPAEPLKGWKLNHVQFVRGKGTAQIGYLDPEDDRFSPIVTVDTGLYYQPDQAAPLAVAILGMLEDAAAHPQQPAPVPLTDAQIAALVLATVYEGDARTPHRDAWAAEIGIPFARAIEAAHGIVPAPTTDTTQSHPQR